MIMDIFVSTTKNHITSQSNHQNMHTQHPLFYFGDRPTFIVTYLFLLGLIIVVIIETKKQELDPKTLRLDYKRRPKLLN